MARVPALDVFERVSNRRAFEEILLQLERAISAGYLAAGDRLPSERDLAAKFEVSRTSVREALRVLETLGVVTVRRGSEHGAVLSRKPDNVFAPTLRLLIALRHVSIDNVVEFRVMIESWAARRLAAGNDEATLAALRETLVDDVSEEEFPALDAAFHRTLVDAAGNELVHLVTAATDGVASKLLNDVMLVSLDWGSAGPRLMAEHRAIYDAIEAGDGDAAAARIAEHAEYWGRRLREASITPGVSATVPPPAERRRRAG